MSNMVVRTNVLALNSHRNLGMVGRQQSNASSRLSSGFRINSAADDAAGLGISEKMRAQIRGLDQASRNAQDGVSLIQTAEGAMSTVNDMVVRIRELVVQAANDTNAHEDENRAQSDRVRIQDEINQLMDEIDATRNRTQFNTRNLIDGSLAGPTVAGFDAAGFDRAVATQMRSKTITAIIKAAGDAGVASDATANAAANALDTAMKDLLDATKELGIHDKTVALLNDALAAKMKERDLYEADMKAAIDAMTGSVVITDIHRSIKSTVDTVKNALMAAINSLDASGISLKGATISTNALFDAITVQFMGDNGLKTMAMSDLLTDLGTDAMGGASLKNAYDAIMKKLNDTMGSSGGNWNGLNLASINGSQAGRDALDAFDKIMNDTISDQAQASVRILIGAVNLDNTLAKAAYDAASAAFADATSEITAIRTDLETKATERLALETTYNTNKSNFETCETTYNNAADIARRAAEKIATSTEKERLETLLRPIYTTEDSEGNSLWFQVGANVDQGVKLSIEDVGTKALSRIGLQGDQAAKIGEYTFDRLRTQPSENVIHGPGGAPTYDPNGGVINVAGEEIQNYITAIDQALAHVTGQRSKLGAMQNRLEYTMQNLDIASENLSASESRIRDADMAKEMMRLTQANVLQQAATAMLAQANQAPQSVLQLLG